jgi:hypothetical protein
MNKISLPTKLYLPMWSGESLWKVNQLFNKNINSMKIYDYVDNNFWYDIFIRYSSRLSQRILMIKVIQKCKEQ